jgi:hypothetical protein
MFVSLPGLAPVGGLDGEAAMRCCKGNYAFYVKINMPAPNKGWEVIRRGNFDARDLVQVKYEMLRRVQSESHMVVTPGTLVRWHRKGFKRC